MAINYQRRPSSWFGPQFKFESFSLPGLPTYSPRGSIVASNNSFQNYEPRQSSNLKPPMEKLPMLEPLFQDSYISSEDDISPSTPDPRPTAFASWNQQQLTQDYFAPAIASETLEDFGLASAGHAAEECDVLATYVSIVKLGKPKVIDILPPTLSRQPSPKISPRAQSKPMSSRPPIVWRMPSYDSSPRTEDMSYPSSERSESFDSRSTYPSSYSEGPKTPSSFSESVKMNETSMVDPTGFPELPSRGSISRSSTQLIRRHSRNLSASFSKAFLTRLKDAESSPPPSFKQAPQFVEPMINYSLPYSATRRPDTPDSFVTNADLHINPQHLAPLTRKAPVLRRKKSMVGVWF